MENNFIPLFLLYLQAEEKANGSDRVSKQIMELLQWGDTQNLTPQQLAEKIHLIYYKEMGHLINR